MIEHTDYSRRDTTLVKVAYLTQLPLGARPGTRAWVRQTLALIPGRYHVTAALVLGQLDVLTLVRTWRADDLGPGVAPDLTPEVLRRVVRGERGWGPLRPLRAIPCLLATYADPTMGHDGALYLAAGATGCGRARGGKLLFAWALDESLRLPLAALGRAVAERETTARRTS